MIYDVKSVSKIKEDNDSLFMFFSTFYGIRIDIIFCMEYVYLFFPVIFNGRHLAFYLHYNIFEDIAFLVLLDLQESYFC